MWERLSQGLKLQQDWSRITSRYLETMDVVKVELLGCRGAVRVSRDESA